MCVNWEVCHNRVGSAQKKKCWRKWRMCGICAVLYHPEEYNSTYVKHIMTLIEKGKRKQGGRA